MDIHGAECDRCGCFLPDSSPEGGPSIYGGNCDCGGMWIPFAVGQDELDRSVTARCGRLRLQQGGRGHG